MVTTLLDYLAIFDETISGPLGRGRRGLATARRAAMILQIGATDEFAVDEYAGLGRQFGRYGVANPMPRCGRAGYARTLAGNGIFCSGYWYLRPANAGRR